MNPPADPPPTTATAAPDLIRAVIGFRQFRLSDGELWSLQVDYCWGPGVHLATCLAEPPPPGPLPHKSCTCGFHAWYRPPPRTASLATSDLLGGAVSLWGRVELHAHGMRAERAAVVALALPFSWGRKRRQIIAAAEALEIRAVPARHLRDAALEYGDVVPRSMQPPDVMPNKRKAPGPAAPARLYAVADGLKPRRR